MNDPRSVDTGGSGPDWRTVASGHGGDEDGGGTVGRPKREGGRYMEW